MSDLEIAHEAAGTSGRYVVRDGALEAELTYLVTSPTTRIAGHTGVPNAMRNRGVGLKLVERMVADARSEGFKIVPRCSFVDAQRRRHPDWADAFAT